MQIQDKGSNKPVKASMQTKFLTPAEKLALQAGSVMQVYVTNIDGPEVQVSLKPSSVGTSAGVGVSATASASIETKSDRSPPRSRAPDGVFNGERQQPDRARSGSFKPRASPNAPSQPPGPLLNNLKTGVKLTGVVQSLTNYAAFLSCGVYRAGKGNTYTPVNGMLYVEDIPKGMALSSRRASSGRKSDEIIDRGSELTVYVKEVFKQSGYVSDKSASHSVGSLPCCHCRVHLFRRTQLLFLTSNLFTQ